MRLREKVKDCEFGPQTYDRILKQLIQTIKDNLITKSVQKRWILDHFLEEASQKEDINQQVKDTKKDYKISIVKHQWGKSQRDARGGARHPSLLKKKPPLQENCKQEHKKEEKSSKNSKLQYCKNTGIHSPGRSCPAYGQHCLKCGKYNHYATCCRSGSHKRQEKSKEPQREKVKKTTAADTDAGSESDCKYLQQTARHVLH